MEFEREEAKHTRTLRERGIGFEDAARIFAGPVLIWPDNRRELRRKSLTGGWRN
jgi:uncharacterized DUF497 family protein